MNKSSLFERLKEERERLGYKSQSGIAELVGVSREMWGKYERGIAMPGGDVIAKLTGIGLDIAYVFTGQRNQPLTDEERMLLESWRKADFMAKHEALKRLSGDATGTSSQKFHGNTIGQVVDGDIKNQEFVMFQQGQGKK